MAIGVALRGVPRDKEQPIWFVESPWWTPNELMEDARFREVHEVPGYLDYVGVLTLEEALAMHERFREGGLDLWEHRVEFIDEKLAAGIEVTCYVIVSVFEWESGL